MKIARREAVDAVRLARGVWKLICSGHLRATNVEDRKLLDLLDRCAEELGDTQPVGEILTARDAREIALDAWKKVEAWRLEEAAGSKASDEQVSALMERIRADEKQLKEIAGKSHYSQWAKELRQALRLNRGVLRSLREERGEV